MSRLVLLNALLLLLCGPAGAETSAYVVNEGSASVSIIDTKADALIATVKVGERPRGLVVPTGAERLYVSHDDGTVSERDLYAKSESGGANLGRLPRSIDLSPDGKLLAAAITGSAEIVLLDLSTMRVVQRIPARNGKQPASAAFSPDGRWIYATAENSPDVDVIDVKRGIVTGSISVGQRLRGVAFLPDSSRAYVAAEQDGEIAVLDAERRTILARVKMANAPSGVTPHPDGKRIFVSAANAAKVQVLDTSGNTIVAEFEACNGPSGMAFTPDGRKLYVTCAAANQVSVFDASTFTRLAQVPVGINPVKVVVSEPPPPLDGDFPPRRGRSRAPS